MVPWSFTSSMSKSKLGSALYKLRKAKGLIEEAPQKILPFRIKRGPLESNSASWQAKLKVPADWIHDVHGEVLGASASDLVRLFPQQDLNQSNLSRVKNGKQAQHKGWRLYDKAKVVERNVIIFNPTPTPEAKPEKSSYYEDLIQRGA